MKNKKEERCVFVFCIKTYMVCASGSVGCCSVMWFCILEADLKAMGQLGHLWNRSQWACWMWDFTELSPPNTTRQLEHLLRGKGQGDVWECDTKVHFSFTKQMASRGDITPVAYAAGKVQTGLIQVCLKQQLLHRTPALGADVWFAASVDALVSCRAAGVGQEHRRRTLRAGLENKKETMSELILGRLLFILICLIKQNPFSNGEKTHSGLCWFDFLEMFSQLFLAAKLSLTLRTLFTDVLNFLCFLVRNCFLLLGRWVRGGLSRKGWRLACGGWQEEIVRDPIRESRRIRQRTKMPNH